MCKCTPNKRTPFCGAPGCECPEADKPEPIESVAPDNINPIDDSREAFMAAIVKLADDEAFRRSFLTHYQLWLHPPMIAVPGLDIGKFNFVPGGITWLDEDEFEEFRRLNPDLLEHLKRRLEKWRAETDTVEADAS